MTAVAAALVAGALLGASPASADCVSAEVSYQRPNQTKQYVVGPKRCIVSTPWGETLEVGTPVGYPPVITAEARVWVPLP